MEAFRLTSCGDASTVPHTNSAGCAGIGFSRVGKSVPHSIYARARDEPEGYGGLVSIKLSFLPENSDKIAYLRSNCKMLFGCFALFKNIFFF